MTGSASDQGDGSAPRRSRRQLLAGGAVGALGVFALETVAQTPQAKAANGGPARPAVDTTGVTKGSAADASITLKGTVSKPTAASPLTPELGISIATLPGIWAATNATTVPAQELLMTLATATETVTLTQMAVWIGAAGAGPGRGVNGLAIYSRAGKLLGQTRDMTSDFEVDNNYAQRHLTAGVAVTAGTNYYLAYLHNFTGTTPAVPGFVPPPGAVPVINGYVLHGYMSNQASFPDTFDPSGLGPGEHWYWVTGSA